MSEAWVTLATTDGYAQGALVLAHSLKASGTSKKLHCMVTSYVSPRLRAELEAQFDEVTFVDVLDSNDQENLALINRPDLGVTFTKLHCWRLTQYTKCVFLDADTMLIKFQPTECRFAINSGEKACGFVVKRSRPLSITLRESKIKLRRDPFGNFCWIVSGLHNTHESDECSSADFKVPDVDHVLQNADELFERPEFSAAADIGWPDCFNSGVFVYVPKP
ncbi:glycosyltransferase, family 8 [Ancylostoma duodenale]|uniref:glycogenin glucosyltransferase n=1 Tax=Ancylostoma duodenale TaxID=51022 RepID=A0A0C2GTX2_9BILA|nr:glycosyltransferase, family 8 [Ancylostoma duodenale]